MPCFRCDVRQTDPIRGDSPWQRGVARGQQVLVCPNCQQASDWAAGLDRCARCGSVRLVKALGAVACRSCGLESWPDPPLEPDGEAAGERSGGEADAGEVTGGADGATPARAAGAGGAASGSGSGAGPAAGAGSGSGAGPAAASATAPDLAAEVSAALERVLRRAPLPSGH